MPIDLEDLTASDMTAPDADERLRRAADKAMKALMGPTTLHLDPYERARQAVKAQEQAFERAREAVLRTCAPVGLVEQERLRALHRHFIAKMGEEFSSSGNPVCAWRAVRLCLDAEIPLPRWLVEYLSDVADKIESASEDASQVDSREAEFIGRALGFGADGRGQRGWLSKTAQAERDADIADRYAERLATEGKEYLAEAYVAKEFGMKPGGVREALKRHRSSRG